MANLTEQPRSPEVERSTSSHSVLVQDIREPGAYVCNWSGDLLRVTDRPVPAEQLPPLPDVPTAEAGAEPPRVVKISSNPYIPISLARMAAANLDLEINF